MPGCLWQCLFMAALLHPGTVMTKQFLGGEEWAKHGVILAQ